MDREGCVEPHQCVMATVPERTQRDLSHGPSLVTQCAALAARCDRLAQRTLRVRMFEDKFRREKLLRRDALAREK